MKEKRGRERSRVATMEERRVVLCVLVGFTDTVKESEYKGIQRETQRKTLGEFSSVLKLHAPFML